MRNSLTSITRNMVSLLIIMLAALRGYSHTNTTTTTIIRTQKQFEEAIKDINRGIGLNLIIKRGTYLLNSNITAIAPLQITGKNATIIANCHIYQKENAVNEVANHYRLRIHPRLSIYSLFTDDVGNIVNISESVNKTTEENIIEDLITGESVTKKNAEVAIPISDNLKHLRNKTFSRAYGYVDCGWSKIDFTVTKSDDRYFYCTTLSTSNIPSINYDKTVYKKNIRYVIYNAELKDGSIYYDNEYIYIPKSHKMIRCLECNRFSQSSPSISAQSDFVLDGLTFEGGNAINIKSGERNIAQITNCTFRNTLGNTLAIRKTNSTNATQIVIRQCHFENCSLMGGNVIALASNLLKHSCITIEHNTFRRSVETHLKNCSGTIYIDADAEIRENTFTNASRCHVYAYKGETCIHDNIIYNTIDFNSRQRNKSNDYGLIYCDHLYTDPQLAQKDTTNIIYIENNLIYGAHAYANDARGIMIDDGRGNVHCTGNLILDTQMYSIDSREVKNFIGTSSIRNSFSNNFVDNKYRLQAGEYVPQACLPLTDNNIILGDIENVTKKVVSRRKDEYILLDNVIVFNEDKVIISKELYNSLRTKEGFNKIKKFIKVGKPSR